MIILKKIANTIKIIFVITSLISCKVNKNKDTYLNRDSHLKNQQDPLKWDKELYKFDLGFLRQKGILPFNVGVFPVAKYDYFKKGSFTGIGNKSTFKKVDNKDVFFNSFYINKNNLDTDLLKDLNDEVYFTIGILTDYLDDNLLNQLSSFIISRNHPDYLGEGSFKTKKSSYDYLAFKTFEGDSFAIVNMKLFDLKFGKIILIAPQKDTSFRFLQVNLGKNISTKELNIEIENLLNRNDVLEFFMNENNVE